MNFPDNCTTPEAKLRYCYAAQEALRKAHNVVGAWHKGGCAKAEWDALPKAWKQALPHRAGALSDADWQTFKGGLYHAAEGEIIGTLAALKNELYATADAVDLDAVLGNG